MGLFSLLGSIYDLDTLDTRLTTPSSVPYSAKPTAVADEGRSKKNDRRTSSAPQTSPSRWATPEFFLYYLVFLVVVPYMFWVPYTVSRRMLCTPSPGASIMVADDR